MKKTKRLTLRKKCDKLWSQIIMARGKCEVCETLELKRRRERLNPHHIIGKKNLTLRHDLKNGCLLCYYHHLGGKISAHNDPLWFQDWLIKNRRDDYNYLMFKRMELTTQVDYEGRIKELENEKEKS